MGIKKLSYWAKIKAKLDKWHILLLVFLIVYVAFMLQSLTTMTIQWDESGHLISGALILNGQYANYLKTDAFYPPLNDLLTAGYFAIGGVSVFVGRLVSLSFAVVMIVAVFEFARYAYGSRTALVSAVLLATMPGFIWLSRVAMLDTSLLFFFSATLMLFFLWLQQHKDRYLLLSGVALGVGFLAKYPIVVTVFVMLISVLLFGRGYIKQWLTKLPLMLLTAGLIAAPWIIILYQASSTTMFNEWLAVMNLQIPQNLSVPAPVYYLVAMVWPYGSVHPISFIVYGLGLAGLGIFVWRHKPQDKFLLVWFVSTYVFFSFLGQLQWRYIVPVFPVLAIAAANLIMSAYGKAEGFWRKAGANRSRVRIGKILGITLISITLIGVAFSCLEANTWIQNDNGFNLPLNQTAQYLAGKTDENESILVLCPLNVFNENTMRFYLYNADGDLTVNVWQYPKKAVDIVQPDFNTTQLVSQCQTKNAKYIVLFEYGETYPYHDSTLTTREVYNMLNGTQGFTLETTFGSYPQKIFVYSFVNDAY